MFTRFCELLGVRLKTDKSDVVRDITFAVWIGTSAAPGNDFALWASLPGGKKKACSSLILSYLAQNRLSYQEIEKLIGRKSFSRTLFFAKFARAQLRSLYTKLYRRVYNAPLSGAERETLQWRGDLSEAFSPRSCRPLPNRCDWLVYTDAAPNPMPMRSAIRPIRASH